LTVPSTARCFERWGRSKVLPRHLEFSSLGEHLPRHTRELVCEWRFAARYGGTASFCGLDPRLEPMTFPSLTSRLTRTTHAACTNSHAEIAVSLLPSSRSCPGMCDLREILLAANQPAPAAKSRPSRPVPKPIGQLRNGARDDRGRSRHTHETVAPVSCRANRFTQSRVRGFRWRSRRGSAIAGEASMTPPACLGDSIVGCEGKIDRQLGGQKCAAPSQPRWPRSHIKATI